MSEDTTPESPWSVWTEGWRVVHMSAATGVLGQEECRATLAAGYRQTLGLNAAIAPEGRFHPCKYQLSILAWSRNGQGLGEEAARELAAADEKSVAVLEGSPEEEKIIMAARQALEKRD